MRLEREHGNNYDPFVLFSEIQGCSLISIESSATQLRFSTSTVKSVTFLPTVRLASTLSLLKSLIDAEM